MALLGSVSGHVLNEDTGTALSGVRVSVVGTGISVVTDAAGRYQLDGVTTGPCDLQFVLEGFNNQTVAGIDVGTEKDPVDVALQPSNSEVLRLDELVVQGETVKGSTGDLRNERQQAAVAIDYLTADQITKLAAGDLADVVFRMPGVSVANGEFAVVRGLSDRFVTTTLQGLKIPSSDPEKQAVQLDLLPSSAVEAVVLAKTFDGTQWAGSSGGNMNLVARAIPDESWARVGLELKFNQNSRDGAPDYAIDGGLYERFGFGSKARVEMGLSDKSWEYVPVHHDNSPYGNKISMEYGHRFAWGERQLGLLFTGFNEANYAQRTGLRFRATAVPGTAATPERPGFDRFGRPITIPANAGRPSDFEKTPALPTSRNTSLHYEEGTSENVLGGTIGVGFRLSPDHEFSLTGIFVQNSIDQSQVNETVLVTDPESGELRPEIPYSNSNGADDYSWFNTYEYFRERNLTLFQLSGAHKFGSDGALKANWAIQRGKTYQKDFPFVEATYATPLDNLYGEYAILGQNDAPAPLTVVWADNDETLGAARIDFDWTKRLWGETDSVLRLGVATEDSRREIEGSAIFLDNPPTTIAAGNPNAAFSELVPDGRVGVPVSSAARRETSAAYITATVPLPARLKAVLGARFEDLALDASGIGIWGNFSSTVFYSTEPGGGSYGQLLGTTAEGSPPFSSRKWYPGAGLIWEPVESLRVRAHFSNTSGQPSLRELSPYISKSIETGNLVIGNPALKPSAVDSYDLRVEWLPTKTELLSLSVFRKEIEDPIEKVTFNTNASASTSTESWINNPNTAHIQGVEFEFTHRLGRWADWLRNVSLSGNFTWMDASVDENPVVLLLVTPFFQDPANIPVTRRLFDQPEYIGNLDLTWANSDTGTSVTLAAYGISDVLVYGGLVESSFDLYQRAYTRFDLVVSQRLTSHLKMKLAIKNMSDPVLGLVYDREATGALLENNRYRFGRVFSASLTYDF